VNARIRWDTGHGRERRQGAELEYYLPKSTAAAGTRVLPLPEDTPMSTWIARRAEVLREFVSWRGVFIVGLLTFREIFRPLFYWHLWHKFETDI
jgi:hypothetical protein